MPGQQKEKNSPKYKNFLHFQRSKQKVVPTQYFWVLENSFLKCNIEIAFSSKKAASSVSIENLQTDAIDLIEHFEAKFFILRRFYVL